MRSFILAGIALLTLGAASSQAQFVVLGGNGGYPWSYNFPNGGFRPGVMPSPINAPFYSGLPGPFSGGSAAGAGYGYPFAVGGSPYYGVPYVNGFGATPLILPGFAATEPPRARPSVKPAIPLPSREVIAAALEGGGDARDRARITLNVPNDAARVWIDGVPMSQSGRSRQYVTPPLSGAASFTLNFRVEWNDDFGRQSRTRAVPVTPGESRTVTIN